MDVDDIDSMIHSERHTHLSSVRNDSGAAKWVAQAPHAQGSSPASEASEPDPKAVSDPVARIEQMGELEVKTVPISALQAPTLSPHFGDMSLESSHQWVDELARPD